ncbi:MAG: hypothetical protein HYV33_03185 [Candidatus Kerfeldbacteria bacterium]|nr:hypothetical protein [Candidatus Kerfeldbacteria bacterium]
MNKESILNVLKSLGAFIVTVVPLLQFGFKWFPEQISGIFIDQNVIFFTTVTTFLLSVFAIFISISYHSVMIPTFKKRKYSDGEIHRIKKMIPLRTIANIMVIFVFAAALGFIWIGSNSNNSTSDNLGFIQAVFYILAFVLTIFIITTYTIDFSDRKKWEENKKDRVRKAINLAKENDGFKIFPRINFAYAKEDSQNRQFIVEVTIDQKNYKIVTDTDAENLYAVYEVK